MNALRAYDEVIDFIAEANSGKALTLRTPETMICAKEKKMPGAWDHPAKIIGCLSGCARQD
jgi:hypothetical protein